MHSLSGNNGIYRPINTGRAPNMAMRKLLNKDVPLGITEKGRQWALRALHPCDDATSLTIGIPDNTQSQSTNMEVRHSQELAAPDGTTANWDCELTVLPCVDAKVVYRTRSAGTTGWSRWHQLSVTSGQILTGGFNPNIWDTSVTPPVYFQEAAVESVPTLVTNSTGFRSPFSGMTVVMNSNSLTNQGFVTAGQWLVKPREQLLPADLNLLTDSQRASITEPIVTYENLKFIVFDDIPSEPDQIVVKCGEAGQWEARKGIYMPMRFSDPVHLYSDADGSPLVIATKGGTIGSDITPNGTPVIMRDVGEETAVEGFGTGYLWKTGPVIEGGVITEGTLMTVAGVINQNIGVAIFSGLDKSAMLVIKTRTGCELQANEDSLLSGTASDAPDKDQLALDMVQTVQGKIPLVYEHKFNSLGFLLPLIAKAAMAVLPHVAPWLINKAAGFASGLFAGGVPNV